MSQSGVSHLHAESHQCAREVGLGIHRITSVMQPLPSFVPGSEYVDLDAAGLGVACSGGHNYRRRRVGKLRIAIIFPALPAILPALRRWTAGAVRRSAFCWIGFLRHGGKSWSGLPSTVADE